jgi:hypothetical protein
MTVDYRRQLGRIRSAKFHLEDHGMFQLCIAFEFGSSTQSFAPLLWTPEIKLDQKTPAEQAKLHRLAAGCWDLLYGVMKLFGVDEVSQIVGQTAYALRDEDHFNDYIRGIERIEADGGGVFSLHDWRKKWEAER